MSDLLEKEVHPQFSQSTESKRVCIKYNLGRDLTFEKLRLCIIPVQIQGTKNTLTYQFLIDTGSQITMLSPHIAKAVGVIESEISYTASGVGKNTTRFKQASVRMLIGQDNGGSLPLGEITIGISNLSETFKKYNILGILGASTLQKLCLQIDYVDKNLELSKH